MSRRRNWIAVIALVILATALATVALPERAEAASLGAKLRVAKHALTKYRHRLTVAEAALDAALNAETGVTTASAATADLGVSSAAQSASPTIEELQARVAKARHAVRNWKRRVHRIVQKVRLERRVADWERRGKWMPIIEIAAAKYHVRADGIYRMMIRESGGRRTAGSDSAFKGLFQYWTGTWSASWNPWRHDSIYDGSSQIYATCYAVSRGMGPQMWTTTFASQY